MALKIRKRPSSNTEEQQRKRIHFVVASLSGAESSMQVDCQSTLCDLRRQIHASRGYSPELTLDLIHGDRILSQSNDAVSLVNAGICQGTRLSIVTFATLHNLPPNVMYVPSDILDVLSHKVSSDRTTITRDDVSQVLPYSAAAGTIMVPIYVHPLEVAPQFAKIGFYPITVEPHMWCWVVKRLFRECGKGVVARVITNARQTYLRLRQEGKLAQLPVEVRAQEWLRMLEQAITGVDEEGRSRDPENPDFWQDEYEIPLCGLTDEQRSRAVEVITID